MAEAGGDSAYLLWVIMGIGVGIVIAGLISLALKKSKSPRERFEQARPPLNTASPGQTPASNAPRQARRCPVCDSVYTDEALIYCVSDGASLVPVVNNSPARDPHATLLYREEGDRNVAPTVASHPDEKQS